MQEDNIDVDYEKLVETLKEKEVKISKKGYIHLSNFVDNILESKNSNQYIKRLDYKKIKISGNEYITQNDCVDIMKKSRLNACKTLLTEISVDVEEDNETIIDVDSQIFQFEGQKFLSFFVEDEDGKWDVWVIGSRVSKYLGYVDTDQSIRDHVDDDNKCTFTELCELLSPVPKMGRESKSIDKKTIFLNISGFMNLIHGSKKPLAKKIKRWLDNEVVPALIRYGKYQMQPKNIKITNFYDENTFSDYDMKSVLYMAYVGKYEEEHIFKFGWSKDMFQREYDQHRKRFDNFNVVFIIECDNCIAVEKMFKKEIKLKNLNRSLTIKKKQQTELFTITLKITHEYFIEYLKKLVEDNQLPAIKEAHNKIDNMSNELDMYKKSEKIRELECEAKKLEYQFKLSKNYKLEVESSIKNKELETESLMKIKELEAKSSVHIKELDLKIQKAKIIQSAIEQGYDIEQLTKIIEI